MERIEEEFSRIVAVVEELTGLPTRWQGIVRVVTPEEQIIALRPFAARKDWDCSVSISTSLTNDDLRWRTLIHEALHSVSVGLTEQDYQRHLGWEEGTVEAIQRQIRPTVLMRLGITAPEEMFAQAESVWLYNHYVAALRQIARGFPDVPLGEFFQEMLRTRLRDRKTAVFAWGKRDAKDFDHFKRVYAAASGLLGR